MSAKHKGFISEWMPVSKLRPVEADISDCYYPDEYAEAKGPNKKKCTKCVNCEGYFCYHEALEVKLQGMSVLFRQNDALRPAKPQERFETQVGSFRNNSLYECVDWLSFPIMMSENQNEAFKISAQNHRCDMPCIPGKFQDMFDCGAYTFAVESYQYRGSAIFSLIRIDRNAMVIPIYRSPVGFHSVPEYIGKYRDGDGYVVIASGYNCPGFESGDGNTRVKIFHPKTLLFRMSPDGCCKNYGEWDIRISPAYNFVVAKRHVWFGQNKMVTRLDLDTGELKYFTNMTDEEMEAHCRADA